MPLYEVIEKTFLDFGDGRGHRLVRPGAKVKFDGWPNSALNPIDEEAVATVELLSEARRRYQGRIPASPSDLRQAGDKVQAQPTKNPTDAILIPENWQQMRPIERLNLAKKLGLPKKSKVADADAAIEAELLRRRKAQHDQ